MDQPTKVRVHVAYVSGAPLRRYERDYVPQLLGELSQGSSAHRFEVETNPAAADLIVLWEGFEYKSPTYVDILEQDPLIQKYADRICVINYDDHPEGFLAGLYTSLEQPFFDSRIHRIWPFFLMNNARVYNPPPDVASPERKWLFSFTGAVSHPIRRKIFDLYSESSSEYHVEHIKKWYDHGDGEKDHFISVARNSSFCLCPHGYCSYTPRITEVMALGRVPVIIADDWIPFSFEEKDPYYVQVPEKDLANLPEILRARAKDAGEIGRNARRLWEKYCSPEKRAAALIELAGTLIEGNYRMPGFEEYRERWHSSDFIRRVGWKPSQRIALRVEQHVRRVFPTARIPGVSDLMRYRNSVHKG